MYLSISKGETKKISFMLNLYKEESITVTDITKYLTDYKNRSPFHKDFSNINQEEENKICTIFHLIVDKYPVNI